MKFSIDQSELTQAIALVSRAVSKRPSRPVLGYIKVVADGAGVTLTGFDEAIALVVRLPCTVERTGELCLPAQLWGDIVSRLPKELVTVAVGEEPKKKGAKVKDVADAATTAIVTCGRGTYEVRGLLTEDYPELPQVEGESFPVVVQVLLDGIAGTLPVCSDDQSKMILQGVHWHVLGEILEFAATDGHRMALSQKDADADLKPIETTIPGEALKILERMLSQVDAADTLQVALDDVQARFEVGPHSLIVRLLEGQYPNYRQLIPTQYAVTVDLPRKPLLAALGRLEPVAAQKNNIVSLQFFGDDLHLSCEATEVGSGLEVVPLGALVPFDDRIAFNSKYLTEALENLTGETVVMKFSSPIKPIVFEAIAGGELQLVMPIQIKG